MISPDNELILTIGYGVDKSKMPKRNYRRREALDVTEFNIPGAKGTYKTPLGEMTVAYIGTTQLDYPVRVGLEGDILKGKGHGRRHGHREPYFEDRIEVQLSKGPDEEVCRGAQSLSKRETIFVSAARANS